MGNTHVKPRPRARNKKQVHWKAADRPSPPGKPQLVPQTEAAPDLVTIRWLKPLDDGGSPITGYLVEHRRTGSPHWVRATPLLVPFTELTLSGLEPGWRYQFRVSAENAVGMSEPGELSEPLTVTLQRSAITAPRFTQELIDTTTLENEKTEFVVYFLGQPAPKVCWYKDGFEIFSSRRIRILTENDRSVLTIHQASLTDEGEIKCTATNRAGHASTRAKLSIEAPPSIRLPRNYEDGLLFELGETIRLKVSLAGRPTPLIFWSHNGESIQNGERYNIENSDKFSILKIDDAARSDRGEYQVKAINRIGEDRTSIMVTVTDKPSAPGKARVVMTLGRTVTLSWSTPSDDGGCKIGNYIIEYYRLGWNVWLKAATTRQQSTVLGDLIEGSEYKFRVKAESPYGVSEPSEESDIVFIPDPKRGITTPSIRSRSQPRDIFDDLPKKPKKPEPRSQSSSRVENEHYYSSVPFDTGGNIPPKRPERTKIKSPPMTPEMSPYPPRKVYDNPINRNMFDRASLARDLAYGVTPKKSEGSMASTTSSDSYKSPEFARKTFHNGQISSAKIQYSPVETRVERRSAELLRTRSPSPAPTPPNRRESSEKIQRQEKSPSPLKVVKSKSPSPAPSGGRSPRENHDNFTGSSEFMLVLYPDENERGHGSASDLHLDLDESPVPPPMSLSAPELGASLPPIEGLKSSSSSTELLHERAMMRFYNAAMAEEAELEKRKKAQERRTSVEIPKIQINSKDDEDIVGLERIHSLRRRLSAGVPSTQQMLWAHRRQSLKNSPELQDSFPLHKTPFTLQQKREMMLAKQRSASQEREEEAFEQARKRTLSNQSSAEKRSIEVVEEEKWEEEEYEESIPSEEETESSEDERRYDITPKTQLHFDEEDSTYHPGMGTATPRSEAPFEILTKPSPLPDPNFVPKPILKKKDYEDTSKSNSLPNKMSPAEKQRAFSLFGQESVSPLLGKRGSLPSTESNSPLLTKSSSPLLDKRGSLSSSPILGKRGSLPSTDGSSSPLLGKRGSLPSNHQSSSPLLGKRGSLPSSPIQAVITHFTLADAESKSLPATRKRADEGMKAVADHYGDILKSYGQTKRSPVRVYSDHDSLKQAAEAQEETTPVSRFNEARQVEKERSPSPQKDKSPPPQRNKSPSPQVHSSRRRSSEKPPSRTPRRFSKSRGSSRTPSKSPVRAENWSNLKTPTPRQSPHRSLSPMAQRRPKMCEIMTQTSVGIETLGLQTSRKSASREKLTAMAEVKVRGLVDYITDLAMFFVACWLYLFKNELLAIPVLLVMVYRQLKDEIRKRMPKWMVRKKKPT